MCVLAEWESYYTCCTNVKIRVFFVKVALRLLKLACLTIPILIVVLQQELRKDETLFGNPIADPRF
jgi:hypothetical protein